MGDEREGIIYVDNTDNFPIHSIDTMSTLFILYNWTSSAIIATPIENTKEETMIKVFKVNITYLSKRSTKPSLNIIDNIASKAIKAY